MALPVPIPPRILKTIPVSQGGWSTVLSLRIYSGGYWNLVLEFFYRGQSVNVPIRFVLPAHAAQAVFQGDLVKGMTYFDPENQVPEGE